MTERKPPGISFESWADRQIREAGERGAFDNLPGAGKPLPGEGRPYDEQWWIRQKMRDEDLSCLPPSLALRKDVQDAREAALDARTESEARRIVSEINVRIREAIRHPPEGPPFRTAPLDPDRILTERRARRGQRD
ncbi:DUF1992 domain-containing protein [Streptomyces sp. HNM0574]|uniref:DnaJ family domain-containing protein n=1 Tax=Streptomyces sp. HNM0574 TaxID=2714954 RepID=UPI00146A9FCF|nr:DUF1992 domain-containing protein [Streptomyces sp. HNM0574]